MRLLVTSSKLYNNDEHVNAVLDFMHAEWRFSDVVGHVKDWAAARMAQSWAAKKGVHFTEIVGPMPDLRPDLVLAFMGSKQHEQFAKGLAARGLHVIDGRNGQQVTA